MTFHNEYETLKINLQTMHVEQECKGGIRGAYPSTWIWGVRRGVGRGGSQGYVSEEVNVGLEQMNTKVVEQLLRPRRTRYTFKS